ncbi:MAG TPA: haloacid dehalogenase-like hydrolase [Polyangia bacterium]|jgi:phosphoserine phosphatase
MTTEPYGLRATRAPALIPDFVRALPAARGELTIFDADGCMWRNDVADDFTLWMIAEGHVPGEKWRTYQRIYRDDHPAGCRYLLSLYTGMTTARLGELVETYWLHHARRQWIWEVIESLYHLAGKGYPIWVVSGTPTDFLLPLTHMLPVAAIVGMDFELDAAGRITGRHAGISCAGEGKAEKLRSLVGDRPIRFACGNGSLDGPMMLLADVAWSVYPNPEFEAWSRAQGWPVLPRPGDFVEEEKFVLAD